MPVYEYGCTGCGHEDEVIKPIREIDDPVFCPSCNQEMKRHCGNAGFKLKGDGWAEDGYDKYIGDIEKTRKRDGKPPLNYYDIHGED